MAHQVLKLHQLPGLGLMAFVAVGHIRDDTQRDFLQTAMSIGCGYVIIDAADCARLLIAVRQDNEE